MLRKRLGEFIDLKGRRFGLLTVMEYVGKSSKEHLWFCNCDCGENIIMSRMQLTKKSRVTVSCGCELKKWRQQHSSESNGTHRLTNHPLYHVWTVMLRRIAKPNPKDKVDFSIPYVGHTPEWSDVRVFIKDMGEPPEGHSLVRFDKEKGFIKENMKFVPMGEYRARRVDNRNITFDGETRTLTAWAKKLGMKPNNIRVRLNSGWTVERALTEPVKPKGANGTYVRKRTPYVRKTTRYMEPRDKKQT